MPIPGILSSDTGAPTTRFKGVTMSGTIADGGGTTPLPPPAGLAVIQSTASIINQIVTTSANGFQRASFVYMPVSTGPLMGMAAPPYVGCGAPWVWNDNLAQINIWSSSRASWMTLIATTSMSAGGFTTSA